MKTVTRIFMCLLLMGVLTAATGCDELLSEEDWSGETWQGGSGSGTFCSDYGSGCVSWW